MNACLFWRCVDSPILTANQKCRESQKMKTTVVLRVLPFKIDTQQLNDSTDVACIT